MAGRSNPIGTLDRRVTILVPTTTVDDFEHPKESFADGDTVWASFMVGSRKESEENKQRVAFDEVVFQIRHRSDLTAKHRLRYDGDEYQITSLVPVKRKARLDIYATHRDNS